jgi:hypothetical protein
VLDLVSVSSISFATLLYYDLILSHYCLMVVLDLISVSSKSSSILILSHYLVPLLFLQMSASDTDSSSDGEQVFELIHKGSKLAEIYTDLYLLKNTTRTSIQTGMGWLEETMRTPGECHKILQMNSEIFLYLHDVLVERYELQPSKHMNTYEMLGIFLFICAACESNRMGQNRYKH